MPIIANPNLDEAILFIIQKDRMLTNKASLINDMSIINDITTNAKIKLVSFERLLNYLSHLSTWDEELITYLGNRFMTVKLEELS